MSQIDLFIQYKEYNLRKLSTVAYILNVLLVSYHLLFLQQNPWMTYPVTLIRCRV